MGTKRVPKLSESTICALYRSGLSRYDVCLRAGIYDRELLAILAANGEPMRTRGEALNLAARHRLGTLTINPPRRPGQC
jgi:hypothetical protein